ncbi:MAG: CobW family GTP-binding protein [Acutalibacter sp.]|jgi:G3E family GTPase
MELYLITGFLGAGKTTFLRQFVRCFQGKRFRVIVNEFGKVGVDGALLQELGGTISQISNGSIFCVCRVDKFEEELQRALEDRPDVVFVEASGLADPTSVAAILEQPKLSGIDYRGSVCLVDTPRLERVIGTARACPKQLAVSSLVLLNKTDLAEPDQIEAAKGAVRQRNPTAVIRETQFGAFEESWLRDIHPMAGEPFPETPDIQLQKTLLKLNPTMTMAQLTSALRMMAEDTWRIKGVAVLEGQRMLVDCVGPLVRVAPTEAALDCENQLVLLAGQGMSLRKTVKRALQWYPNLMEEVSL